MFNLLLHISIHNALTPEIGPYLSVIHDNQHGFRSKSNICVLLGIKTTSRTYFNANIFHVSYLMFVDEDFIKYGLLRGNVTICPTSIENEMFEVVHL